MSLHEIPKLLHISYRERRLSKTKQRHEQKAYMHIAKNVNYPVDLINSQQNSSCNDDNAELLENQ